MHRSQFATGAFLFSCMQATCPSSHKKVRKKQRNHGFNFNFQIQKKKKKKSWLGHAVRCVVVLFFFLFIVSLKWVKEETKRDQTQNRVSRVRRKQKPNTTQSRKCRICPNRCRWARPSAEAALRRSHRVSAAEHRVPVLARIGRWRRRSSSCSNSATLSSVKTRFSNSPR